jgi:hypothetical protein
MPASLFQCQSCRRCASSSSAGGSHKKLAESKIERAIRHMVLAASLNPLRVFSPRRRFGCGSGAGALHVKALFISRNSCFIVAAKRGAFRSGVGLWFSPGDSRGPRLVIVPVLARVVVRGQVARFAGSLDSTIVLLCDPRGVPYPLQARGIGPSPASGLFP